MLTSDTLAKLQSGVHPNFFSQSLQDAIKVVLACGLRHLWVDAICILQDDPSEMALEIQNMGDIYYDTNESNKAYFSRRYVQFGLHSVTVECATTTTDSGGTAWGVNSNPPLRLTQPTTLETSPSDWDGVIQMYSSRRLTMPSDKLVAISAMAKDAARRLHDPRPENYLAGLWRQNLARGLLWEMKDDPQPRPTCYRAPSWSWASVDGKVDVATADISNYRLTVLDAATSWDTMTGPFSAVTEGFVLVRAQMMNISGCVVYKDWKIQFYDISGHLDAAEPSLLHDSDQRPSMWLVLGLEERSRVATGGIPSDRYFEDDDVRVFGAKAGCYLCSRLARCQPGLDELISSSAFEDTDEHVTAIAMRRVFRNGQFFSLVAVVEFNQGHALELPSFYNRFLDLDLFSPSSKQRPGDLSHKVLAYLFYVPWKQGIKAMTVGNVLQTAEDSQCLLFEVTCPNKAYFAELDVSAV
ncbi:hypothetical protein OQA88_8425 [Cercophora sp. LCS_1]